MSIRLTLIGAGATAATRAAAFPMDEPLEDIALARAAALAGSFGRAGRALTGPALAARQTAAALSLEADIEPALADWNQGRWAGRRLADLQTEEPDAIAAWLTDPDAAPHGGESVADLCRRVSTWMDGSVSGKGRVVAITHAAVIRAAILHVLDAPVSSFWRIDIEPLSATDLRGDGRRWRLRSIGSVLLAGK